MEKEKNGKGFLVLLIIIIGVLLILCILFATDTISLNSDNAASNITEVDNNDTSNNIVTKKNNLLDLSKLEKYKNYDGTYGTKKIFSPSNDGTDELYNIKLSLDGKVSVCDNNGCNNISNTNDVIDIAQMVIAGEVELWKYYILQDNGDVYCYELENYKKGNYTATKVTNVSNIVELVNFSYNDQKNAGGLWGILAITQDNQYIEIDTEGV